MCGSVYVINHFLKTAIYNVSSLLSIDIFKSLCTIKGKHMCVYQKIISTYHNISLVLLETYLNIHKINYLFKVVFL